MVCLFMKMSRIMNSIFFLKKNNFWLKNFNFFLKNSSSIDFYKDSTGKGFLLRNIYMYYDLFFFSISIVYFNKNIYFLNFIFFKNFKKFINYFYNSSFLGRNFVVIDNDYRISSPFFYLCYTETVLIKYNSFFNKNDFFLKQAANLVSLKRFFRKTNTTTLIILNYDDFYKYTSLYSSFNAAIISFVLPNTKVDLLDFFLFKSKYFYVFEKLFFLAKIYSIYSVAMNCRQLNMVFLYKTMLKKIYL